MNASLRFLLLVTTAFLVVVAPAHAADGHGVRKERSAEDEALIARWARASEHRLRILREVGEQSEALDELLLAYHVGIEIPQGTKFDPNRDRQRSALLLARMLDLHPDETIVRQHVAAFCRLNPEHAGRPCAGYDAVRAFADADRRNALPWLMWSARAKERGDLVEAWWALERAADAERVTIHYREYAVAVHDFIERTSVPELDETAFARANAIFGYTLAGSIPPLGDMVALCGSANAPNVTDDQAHLCIKVGTLLSEAQTFLEVSLGVRMLEGNARTASERKLAKAARLELEARQASHSLLPDWDYSPTPELEKEWMAYLDDMLEHGEMEASRRLIRRAGFTLEAWRAAAAKVPMFP